ncbi:unnamed protein product [Owenia fusiformis]|uniref:Uncharacterized protein n=1 Tax=Owenia fusiformis TaxID=6347 RepID=A0A8S4PHP1_OWEFU|nr:unnamed protein product [Owenia fusiformis]
MEAVLEEYIRKFLYDKRGEQVFVDLKHAISVKHVQKHGSTTLASTWVNILQHPDNYPTSLYAYKSLKDRTSGVEKVMLKTDDITFTVFMKTGTLTLQGNFAHEWFVQHFKGILDRSESCITDDHSVLSPTRRSYSSNGYRSQASAYTSWRDADITNTEARRQLDERDNSAGSRLYRSTLATEPILPDVDYNAERKIEDGQDDILLGMRSLNMNSELMSRESVHRQLESLNQVGGIKDGPTYIYKLWKSLLDMWISTEGNKVYIVSPFMDADRLADVAEICMNNAWTANNLTAIYARRICDGERTISDLKRDVLTYYNQDEKKKLFVEYKVFSKIIYPVKTFHAKFIATTKDGMADVLVTSANFHGSHFVRSNMETVFFVRMTEQEFLENYINPIKESVQG